MASIDERIVSMNFSNAKFEAGVAKTMASLAKLNESLKLTGAAKGLQDIDAAANKVTLSGASLAADKLKSKMEFSGAVKGLTDIQGASDRVTMGSAGTAADGLKGKIQSMATSAGAGLDSLKSKFSFPGAERAFSGISAAASRINFGGVTSAIENLKGKFSFGSGAAQRSFAEIEAASNKVRFSGIQNAVANVGSSFSILEGAAAVAFGNIATKAAIMGANLGKSLSVNPVMDGFKEYEQGINSVQTILGNTKAAGITLKDVEKSLQELNVYADKTIYNFGQMTKNIGTFTAAGVDLKTATASIKGISNLAALSGTSAEDASRVMYQLSQAISTGKVSMMDWKSVENASMGGTVFQRSLAETAVAMGKLDKTALQLKGPMKQVTIDGKSFRQSISADNGDSWLSKDVLLQSLKSFTGDMSDAELSAKGFTKAQIKAIQVQAKTALDAATQVKTFTALISTTKEQLGTGFADSFKLLLGNFGDAKKLFTGISNAIGGIVGESAKARNKILGDFVDLGGRTKLIEGFKNAFTALTAVFAPIKEAFREIFPRKTGKDLTDLATRFADFTEKLKIGPEMAENLKRTFAGFFAVLSIGKTIVGAITSIFFKLLGVVGSGSGGFLDFTGSIGDFFVSLDKALKSGKGFSAFFEDLPALLQAPLTLLGKLRDAITNLFKGDSTEGATETFDKLTVGLAPLKKALIRVNEEWDKFKDTLDSIGEKLSPITEKIRDAFTSVVTAIKTVFKGVKFDDVFQALQTTFIGGIFFALKKALGGGINIDLGDGALGNLSKSLETLNGSLKSIQQNIKANTLFKIAAALALLTVSVVALSLIDAKRLAVAMTAIAVGLGQLIGAMALLMVGGKGAFGAAFAMVVLAGALVILSAAVTIMSKLNGDELSRGLAGVAGVLIAVGVGVNAIPKSIVLIGPALIPIAIALNLLAVAMKIFATLSWGEILKGLIGIGEGLLAIAFGLRSMPTVSLLIMGPGLIAVAVALNLLAFAVAAFGNMNLLTLGKGLLGIGASLVVIGYAIAAIPPTVAVQAAGLIVLAVALTGIATAVGLMGGMKMSTIAKGLIGIGGSLTVLAQGLYLMIGTLPGAVALVAAATGLAILTPVLAILGSMKWTTVAKGLAVIATSLGLFAVLGPLAGPGLLAIGIGLQGLGAGFILMGAGLYLMAKGISLLATDGKKGATAMFVALTAFLAILPTIIINFLKGLVTIVVEIAKLAPVIVDSLVKIINSLLDVVIQAAPKMALAAGSLILAILTVLNENAGPIITAGINLILNFLQGIRDNIGQIATLGFQIITTYLTTLAANLPRIMAAGANVLVQFLAGVATALPRVIAQGVGIVTSFLNGITQALPRIIPAGARVVVTFLNQLAGQAPAMIRAGANLIVRVLTGMGQNANRVARAAARMIGDFLNAAAQAMIDLSNRIGNIIVNFLNGLADAINTHSPAIRKAGWRVAVAIINGITGGLGSLAGRVTDKIGDIIGSLPKRAFKILGIKSPSTVFQSIGEYTMLGLAQGLGKGAPGALRSVEGTANNMVGTMRNTLSAVPDILDGLVDMDPVIAPVLDLSSVESEARKLDSLTNVTPITAAASYGQAASISTEQEATAQQNAIEAGAVVPPQEIKFEQNNYSPESLSATEVYRQTNNQLGQAKQQLGIA